MGLEFVHLHNINEEMVTVDRHLYLTGDRSRVVEEGDPDGRTLWASPGQQVSRRDAERLGALTATPDRESIPDQDAVDEPDSKKSPAPANKQRRPRSDKSAQ